MLSQVDARLVNSEGIEINNYNEPGELLVQSPSNMKGYLGDEAASQSVCDPDGWLRTGDVAVFKPNLHDGIETAHLFIMDIKKDVMTVKGLQVAPVEIESRLASHPAVMDVAVIGVRDEDAGEPPYAFIVRSPKVMVELDDEALKDRKSVV